MSEWRPVAGYEGLYWASRDGQVRSRRQVLLPQAGCKRGGYLRVNLWKNGRAKQRKVHQLVAETFIGPRPVSAHTRHLNGDERDNRAENLAYGSASDNLKDAVRHGRVKNANKTHCLRGHAFSEDNTYRNKKGERYCRACQPIRKALEQAKRAGTA